MLKKERYSLCNDDVNVVYILGLLQRNETQKWQEKFLHNKWLHIHEEIAYKQIITGNKITELKSVGKCLYKVKKQFEKMTEKTVHDLYETRDRTNSMGAYVRACVFFFCGAATQRGP